jgi:hypothetical protein
MNCASPQAKLATAIPLVVATGVTAAVSVALAFSGRGPIGGGATGLSYCMGGRQDPGQLVTVSPIEATFQATTSLP